MRRNPHCMPFIFLNYDSDWQPKFPERQNYLYVKSQIVFITPLYTL